MTHSAAVSIIVKLVPEIEKQGAERVLSDYATREDLTPAKLEKLAQVYNTLRQVSHIDGAEPGARGATVGLVDIPRLVMDYATQETLDKVAAPNAWAMTSHDARQVDLNSALRRDINGGMQKAAATVPLANVDDRVTLEISRDDARAAFLEMEVDLEHSISKLACELFAAAPAAEDRHFLRDVSQFEADALRRYHTDGVIAAGDYMEKFAAAHRTKLVRHDYGQPLVKFAYPVESAMGDKFAQLAHELATLSIVKAAAADDDAAEAAIRAAYQAHLDGQDAQIHLTGDLPISPDADMSFGGLQGDPNAAGGEGVGNGQDTAALLGETQDKGLTSRTSQEPASRTPREPKDDDDKPKKDGGNKNGGGKGSGKADGILDALAIPITATSNAIVGASQKANEALSGVVNKERVNKAQRDSDMSVEDIQRAMRLRRLIGTDPVLREADPAAVLEVYNAVAARNPDIANDMASLRLILREAVSYEGLTLEAQKTLSEIRRNSAQGQKESDEIDRKRYSAGGANPISFT